MLTPPPVLQVSLGYLLLVAAIVGNHPQQGLFTKRRWMWAVIAAYAAISLSMRVIYQLPAFPESFRTNSIQVRAAAHLPSSHLLLAQP